MLTEQETLGIIKDNLRREVEAHPSWPDMWNSLGLKYAYQGDHAEAITCFQKAIEINPRFKLPYTNLAFSLIKEGRSGEAIGLLKVGREKFKNDDFWAGLVGAMPPVNWRRRSNLPRIKPCGITIAASPVFTLAGWPKPANTPRRYGINVTYTIK